MRFGLTPPDDMHNPDGLEAYLKDLKLMCESTTRPSKEGRIDETPPTHGDNLL